MLLALVVAGWSAAYANGCGAAMNLVDRLKSAHSFHGDPLHREAWEEIEELQYEKRVLEAILSDILAKAAANKIAQNLLEHGIIAGEQ